MTCKICDENETDNPDGICDDCKVSIISDEDIAPNSNQKYWLYFVFLLI